MRLISIVVAVVAALFLAAPLAAEPPGKPTFLRQGDNADIAYCFVLLKDGRYLKPNTWEQTTSYLTTAAYLWMILEERAGKDWDSIQDDVLSWTTRAIEEDIAKLGAPRLSPQNCLALARSLQDKTPATPG